MLPFPSPDRGPVALRPAVPADAPHIQALVRGLRPHTRYLRFFNAVQELSLLALERDSGAVVAMAQYAADPYPQRADFAVVVADAWQGRRLGTQLIRSLLEVARPAGIERLEAEVLAETIRAARCSTTLRFHL